MIAASESVAAPVADATLAGRPVRLLVFTSLYPNAAQPRHGIFVEERLRKLVASGRVTATVVAPVPWFPFKDKRFGHYAAFARVPAREERHGIPVLHPRYPVIPKVGMNVASVLMYRAVLRTVRRMLRDGAFDLIDAHYLYPDGVVAARLGRKFGLPVVMTARGNDVTLIPKYLRPRQRILEAVEHASATITVSNALREQLIEMGGQACRLQVLRNGVDMDRFGLRDRVDLRGRFGVSGVTWLAVGHLIERKGVHFVMQALAMVPDATLLIAGDGPDERDLRKLAETLGVESRVRFLGAIAHDDLCDWYNAADVLMLASSREGMPNVVLEALACGTPVVAAPFDGVAELICAPEAGEIAEARSAAAIVSAWQRLLVRRPARAATRHFAEQFGWQPVVEAQCALYVRVLAGRRDEDSGQAYAAADSSPHEAGQTPERQRS